jgi:hypothetical protein
LWRACFFLQYKASASIEHHSRQVIGNDFGGFAVAVWPFEFPQCARLFKRRLGYRRELFQKNHYCIYHIFLNNYTQEPTEQRKLGIDIQGGDSKAILPNREQAGAACSRAVNF